MSSYYISVDIGGTFTDVVIQDTDTGAMWTTKVPSTPEDHSIGFIEGIRSIQSISKTQPADGIAAILTSASSR